MEEFLCCGLFGSRRLDSVADERRATTEMPQAQRDSLQDRVQVLEQQLEAERRAKQRFELRVKELEDHLQFKEAEEQALNRKLQEGSKIVNNLVDKVREKQRTIDLLQGRQV